ncbi:unnamed protein product [Scytosiphon promiscuus]
MASPRTESPVQALPLFQPHHKLAFHVLFKQFKCGKLLRERAVSRTLLFNLAVASLCDLLTDAFVQPCSSAGSVVIVASSPP